MLNVGYQSKTNYLALPDILKTSFDFAGQAHNARTSSPATFHAWLLSLADEWDFQNVDTSSWQVHHRWRVINTLLKDGTLQLSEVDGGYKVELPPEEKSSYSEEKPSELFQLPEVPPATTTELRDDIDALLTEIRLGSGG